MAKIKVHELAKELGKESKDVIAFLDSNGIEAKAQSGVEDDMADRIRKHFAKPAKADANKGDKKPRPVDKDGNPIKKKKNVFVVTRGSDDRKRRSSSDASRTDKGGARDNRDKKQAQTQQQPRGPIRPRTFSDGLRPSQRASAQSTDTEFVSKKKPVDSEAAPKQDNRGDKNKRTDRNERTERQPRNDRQDRPARNDKNDRRDNRDNNRGDRPSQRNNNRPSQQAAPAADVAPSNNAKGGRRDDKKKKNNRDNNNLGGKKQENFINLEKNGGKKKKNNAPKAPERNMDEVLTITIPERITIKDLADKMKVQASAVVKTLFLKGKMVTVNQEVDFEEASEIALEFNCICEEEEKVDVIAELLKEEEEDTSNFPSRPPVVCVMGHVDHGKTSLLDAIRDTKVTDREAGGITQHIGAYTVSINGQDITFLDTPGHEAFTAMRMRGANSTDIAILVVAADDGVMPQTVEAINHAKAAGIEIIVAINKIDKPNANIDRVKQELSEYQLIPEDWGGSTVFCPVSAHTKEGIDNLLEMILLTAEVLELKANPKRKARGLVIEAQLDKGRGAVATVLVQKGTLHVGDPVACGSCHGKVRAMIDDTGARVKTAGPSVPVEILGLSEVPNAGEVFMAFDSEKEAHAFADTFVAEHKNRLVEQTKSKMSLDALFSEIESGNLKELDIIVKADVQGSVEAVKQSLEKLSNEEVVVKTIHGGVGTINESDVVLASASNAIIIGFNVRVDPQAKMTADREGVDLRLYKVIYDAINDVESAMKGMLDPVFEEKVIGHAEVRQIFKASGVGNIAGSYVTDGYFQRDCMVRVTREGELIHEGKLGSLKRFKDDVKEVKSNFECGLVIEDFNDVQEMDIIEAYIMVEVPR
ncbi:translation initiation factor IF-2 [Pseudobutyrivibrio ruminis]|uniref:translation initiation factor IF-2 n=1 Tax=Pseudobutyrivibrio ruminis TaxID=46206 RepID=UPI0004058165|nr:translation initiation factor IF-2 [Pseudobutyrivibrio ruminis]